MKLDANGNLVNDDGSPFLVEGKTVALPGYVTEEKAKELANNAVQTRMKREDEATTKKIKQLEEELATATKTAQREDLTKKIGELEEQLNDSSAKTARELARVKQTAEADVVKYSTEAKQWKERYQRQVVTTDLTQAATNHEEGIVFVDPADLVRTLSGSVVWEDAVDVDGKPTGEQTYKVRLKVEDETTKKLVDRDLTAAEAAKVIAKKSPHYLAGQANGGPQVRQNGNGGGNPINGKMPETGYGKLAAGFGAGKK